MACSCIKNDFNLIVESRGCNMMSIRDVSSWMEDTGFELPEDFDVEIKGPGGKKDIVKVSTKGISAYQGLNQVSAVSEKTEDNKGITPCLEDGIYCFTTTSCGVQYGIVRAFLCEAECKLSELKLDDNPDWDKISRLDDYIESAKEAAMLNMVDKAGKYIELVNNQLDKPGCCP